MLNDDFDSSSEEEESQLSLKSQKQKAKSKNKRQTGTKINRKSICKAKSPIEKPAHGDKGGGTRQFKSSTFKPGWGQPTDSMKMCFSNSPIII